MSCAMTSGQPIHYLISEPYALRGWKRLPYAVQNLHTTETRFMGKEAFELLSSCNGIFPMEPQTLENWEKHTLEEWLESGLIRRAEPGEMLAPEQEYRFFPARFKEAVHWSVTGRCNYRCRHCFMSAPHAVQGEPSFEDCVRMLESFQRCGIRAIHLTGGEPLVRRDFWQLVDEIYAHDMVIAVIYSNGLLVTDEFLDELQRRKIRCMFQFSFDGVGYHDWMRGVDGAEKIVIDAMKRCNERGFPWTASMVLCKESLGTIRESAKLLGELGCKALKVGPASPAGEWLNQPEHFLTIRETFQAFLDYIPHYYEDGKPVRIGLEGMFNYEYDKGALAYNEKHIEPEDWPKAVMCGHVRGSIYVSPQGKVLPCMTFVGTPMEQKFPSMLETPLEEILDESLYMHMVDLRVSDYMDHNPECRTCEYGKFCAGGCRAVAVNQHPDDFLAKDLWSCEYFKGGWRDKKYTLLRELAEKGYT